MENWIFMLSNKLKNIFAKLNEHDGKFNSLNNSIIDIQSVESSLVNLIGDSADTGGSATTGTVMGKGNTILSLLTSGGTKVVKSIQHVTYSVPINTSSGTIRISTVIPSKCVVIFERLEDGTSGSAGCSYSLGANEIQIGHGSYSRNNGIQFGFWIVEFY